MEYHQPRERKSGVEDENDLQNWKKSDESNAVYRQVIFVPPRKLTEAEEQRAKEASFVRKAQSRYKVKKYIEFKQNKQIDQFIKSLVDFVYQDELFIQQFKEQYKEFCQSERANYQGFNPGIILDKVAASGFFTDEELYMFFFGEPATLVKEQLMRDFGFDHKPQYMKETWLRLKQEKESAGGNDE